MGPIACRPDPARFREWHRLHEQLGVVGDPGIDDMDHFAFSTDDAFAGHLEQKLNFPLTWDSAPR